MAPTVPSKRSSIRSKASKSSSGVKAPPAHREGAVISDSFINSKRDKQKIKHSAFVHRIEKGHAKPLKRRRPNKKLVTTLEGLADALPDVESLVNVGNGGFGPKGSEKKSLKSRPGAMKRKEKLERGERERFGKNLASIMSVAETSTTPATTNTAGVITASATEGSSAPAPAASAGRFAALRAWVDTNMEKHPAFEKGTS